jgi:hypothetical protein
MGAQAATQLQQQAQLAAIMQNAALDPHAYLQSLANQVFSGPLPGPPPPPKIEDAGITVGEITAFRVWRYRRGFLFSMAADAGWAPGEPMRGDVSGGYLGVHAWKSMAEAITYGGGHTFGGEPVVLGRVALWGEVIEHERGYRAECAKITALDDVMTDRRRDGLAILAELRERYGLTPASGRPEASPRLPAPGRPPAPPTGWRGLLARLGRSRPGGSPRAYG